MFSSFSYFMNNRIQVDLLLKIIHVSLSNKRYIFRQIAIRLFVVLPLVSVLVCLKYGKFATFVFMMF